jgi:ribosomal protein L11 methyltransferase
MDVFWVVTLFQYHPGQREREALEALSVGQYDCSGIEEFSLSEPEVDEILGDRSYSGGDLPEEVLSEVEDVVLARPLSYRFFFNSKNSAELFLSYVRTNCLCESQLEELISQDWNAEWKKHYSPIWVNSKLEIIPSWVQGHQSKSEKQIFIYPGMGFGTGSHETTFLCLKLLTENVLPKKLATVLDFGSGSGILGLSSLLFWPGALVDFYDIDPEANKNCFQNASINQLDKMAFRLLLPQVRRELRPAYDLVFANILESILLQEIDALVGHTSPGGSIILSGLLRPQAPGIVQAYTAKGLKLERQIDQGDWSALYLVKAKT